MYKLSYEEILGKIVEEKGISKEEIEEKVNAKMEKLSGLISKEGAVHIIANEYNVKVFYDLGKKKFKINELRDGMRSVEVFGKVIKKYDTREFKTDKREGKVSSLLTGDETGMIRFVFWDTNIIEKVESVNENDVVKVMNGYVRDNQGYLEVHIGSQGEIEVNPQGVEIKEVSQVSSSNVVRKKLSEVKEGDFVEVLGTIVQVFEPRFYDACNECNKKVVPEGDGYKCSEHGKVSVRHVPIVNAFFDDGTGNTRIVCFRENASKLLKISEEELMVLRDNLSGFEEIRKKVLGEQVAIKGKVNKNEMFDRTELAVSGIEEINPGKLIEEMSK